MAFECILLLALCRLQGVYCLLYKRVNLTTRVRTRIDVPVTSVQYCMCGASVVLDVYLFVVESVEEYASRACRQVLGEMNVKRLELTRG
jgi:hypothetical protein